MKRKKKLKTQPFIKRGTIVITSNKEDVENAKKAMFSHLRTKMYEELSFRGGIKEDSWQEVAEPDKMMFDRVGKKYYEFSQLKGVPLQNHNQFDIVDVLRLAVIVEVEV